MCMRDRPTFSQTNRHLQRGGGRTQRYHGSICKHHRHYHGTSEYTRTCTLRDHPRTTRRRAPPEELLASPLQRGIVSHNAARPRHRSTHAKAGRSGHMCGLKRSGMRNHERDIRTYIHAYYSYYSSTRTCTMVHVVPVLPFGS